jgi:hypothetical protein
MHKICGKHFLKGLVLLIVMLSGCATGNIKELKKLQCEQIKEDLIKIIESSSHEVLVSLAISMHKEEIPPEVIYAILSLTNSEGYKKNIEYQANQELEVYFKNVLENSECMEILSTK